MFCVFVTETGVSDKKREDLIQWLQVAVVVVIIINLCDGEYVRCVSTKYCIEYLLCGKATCPFDTR